MTPGFIQQFNALGHWINQNFVLRLYAVLESNALISDKISIKPLEGNEEMDILRRLRNSFAHGSGRCDQSDPERRKLRERIVFHFGLDLNKQRTEADAFPIPIDSVLIPLAEGCKRYAVAVAKTV